MRTIYVKKNFPLILISVAFIISSLYLIDFFYFKEINQTPVEQSLITINANHLNKNFVTNSTTMLIKESPTADNYKCSVTIALILCEANQYLSLRRGRNQSKSPNSTTSKPLGNVDQQPLPLPPLAKDFSRQINQTLVMLKSVAIQTLYDPAIEFEKNCINVIILSDRKSHFEKIQDKIQADWSQKFQNTLNLTYIPVKYPPGSGWMKKMFRPCATLRLFIPELLPKEYDSIVYLDTDFIFLRSVQSLLKKYSRIRLDLKAEGQDQGKVKEQIKSKRGKKVLAGMAPCLFHYGTKSNLIPYYGSSGLNAGLMLMNLSQMRESMWTNKIRMVTAMFQHEIKLADQDILNIYFHFFPEELTPLTCDWNFRPFQCREGNYCEDPNLAGGISALHGNALSFTQQGPEPLFYTVFKAFHELKLDEDFNLETFVENLETELLKAEETLHSDCVRYGGFSVMVLNRLDKLIRVMDLRGRDRRVDNSDASGTGNNISEDFDYNDHSMYLES